MSAYIYLIFFVLLLAVFAAGYFKGRQTESIKNQKQKQDEDVERKKYLAEKEKTIKEITENGKEKKKDLYNASDNRGKFNNSINKLQN